MDLTIVDCRQGLEVLEQAIDDLVGTHAVMALIDNNHGLKQRVFSMGVIDYITSPVIAQELLTRIKMGCCLADADVAGYRQSSTLRYFNRDSRKTEKEQALVKATCRYLLSHFTLDHTLDNLAHIMATNRNTLASSFKSVLGIGVFAWLREQRMKKAKTLLNTTNLSIQQICYEVGYNDPANFSTAFKICFKLAPQKYRKRHDISGSRWQ